MPNQITEILKERSSIRKLESQYPIAVETLLTLSSVRMPAQEATSPVQPVEPQIARPFSFRLALPLGQLVICALLLLPIRGYIFYELGLTRLTGPSLPFQIGGPLLQPFTEWSLRNGLDTVAALNLPGGLVQLPYAIFGQDHDELKPQGIDFKVWRAITWPIGGVLFWWIAGRGAEALVAALSGRIAPRIRWIEVVLACAIVLVCGSIAVVFPFMEDVSRDGALVIFGAGSAVWTFLGGFTLAARIAQWRIRKKLRAEPTNLPG